MRPLRSRRSRAYPLGDGEPPGCVVRRSDRTSRVALLRRDGLDRTRQRSGRRRPRPGRDATGPLRSGDDGGQRSQSGPGALPDPRLRVARGRHRRRGARRRGDAVRRADPGRQPESQGHRADEPVPRHGPERRHGRVRPAGRSVDVAQGVPPALQLRPVPDPQAAGARRRGQPVAAPHPPGQGGQEHGHRGRSGGAGDRPHRAGERVRQDQLRARVRRGAAGVDQGRELAGLELEHRGRQRRRGGPDHEDVRGHRQDGVHHRRQLRRAAPRQAAAATAHARHRRRGLDRHRAQAGRPRARISASMAT